MDHISDYFWRIFKIGLFRAFLSLFLAFFTSVRGAFFLGRSFGLDILTRWPYGPSLGSYKSDFENVKNCILANFLVFVFSNDFPECHLYVFCICLHCINTGILDARLGRTLARILWEFSYASIYRETSLPVSDNIITLDAFHYALC